jgi:hypothetical protein
MRLFEFFENNPQTAVDKFFDQQRSIERTFNSEAYHAQLQQEKYYKDNNMVDNTPVFKKPAPYNKDEMWSNQPDHKAITSPGYRGLQNVKRRAGHEYDKDVEHKDPHANPALSPDEHKLIKNAHRRLGRLY